MDLQPFQPGRLAAEDARSRSYKASPGSPSPPTKSFSAISSQSLASILNNPHGGKSGVYSSDAYWTGWWGSSSTAVNPPEFTPLLLTKPLPEVSRSDFVHYISLISEPHCRFEDVRNHTSKEDLSSGRVGCAGEALLACLLEVPVLYFKEDFALEYGSTFQEACPFSRIPENILLQEKLSQYLDVVELHLVKEISLRSDSFFEAQGRLQDLNGKIVEGCSWIRKLKETIQLLDADLVESASEIQELYGTRSNLIALQQKLRLILYVNQAISALKLLVTSGDCAGALDVTDGLKHLLGGDELAGLHCFLHLRDHVVDAIDSVNSILSGDFMRASLSDARENDVIVFTRAKSTTFPLSKVEEDVFGMEDISSFRDRFLPIVIGLLRTTKLPSVLRAYRETLTSDMKVAIKTSVAKLLPVLVVRPTHTDYTSGERSTETDSGGLSLPSKLRSLSSDNFVELLDVIFKIVQVHLVRASEVKKAIEWIMLKCNGNYATDSLYSAINLGTITYGAIEDRSHQIGASPKQFSRSSPDKIQSFKDKSNDIASPSNISKNLRADILRENTEALFAACDVAHGRWAKLLGVRSILHPKLRLQEFLSVYGITKEFVTTTEKIGGRLGYSIRGTLQSQAKAFIDFQHDSRMAKIKAVLDQETWVEVDVPDEFQAIATSVFCSESEHERLNSNEFNLRLNSSEVASSNGDIPIAEAAGIKSGEIVQQINPELSESTDRGLLNSSSQNHSNNMKERKSSQTLCYKDADYHMVNCGLILLKILSEYINLNDSLPILSSEVVHRVVEVLKFFNTRTCQLVLGAGAIKVAGLKSITSKHLALASQVISFIYSIIPEFRQILFLNVPEARKVLLMSEFDRVAQDCRIHRDEIHTKLVQIMRERLLFHLRDLPQIVENWNRSEDGGMQPSQFAKSLTKEVGFFQRVLSRTLHMSDVQSIFRNVVMMFHLKISEAFLQLEISNPNVKRRLYGETQHILGCIRTLPSDESSDSGIQNWGKLDEFMKQTYGSAGSE